MQIGIDMMGGDFAPAATVQGVLLAAEELKSKAKLLLIGNERIIREEFASLLAGRQPNTVVHHCGSGVSAIPNVLAMEIAGLGPTGLYAGSWSEWCTTPGLPCEKS